MVGGSHPADRPRHAGWRDLQGEGQAFGTEPEPDPASRAEFGEMLEDRADRAGDSRIGMEENLTVLSQQYATERSRQQNKETYCFRGAPHGAARPTCWPSATSRPVAAADRPRRGVHPPAPHARPHPARSAPPAAVALNPATPASAVAHVLDLVDLVLVMTVNPGFGGQAYIATMEPKIREVRAVIEAAGLADRVDVEVDGGIGAGHRRRRRRRRGQRARRRLARCTAIPRAWPTPSPNCAGSPSRPAPGRQPQRADTPPPYDRAGESRRRPGHRRQRPCRAGRGRHRRQGWRGAAPGHRARADQRRRRHRPPHVGPAGRCRRRRLPDPRPARRADRRAAVASRAAPTGVDRRRRPRSEVGARQHNHAVRRSCRTPVDRRRAARPVPRVASRRRSGGRPAGARVAPRPRGGAASAGSSPTGWRRRGTTRATC